jgi:hypothetical protein
MISTESPKRRALIAEKLEPNRDILNSARIMLFKLDYLSNVMPSILIEKIFPENRTPLSTLVFAINNPWLWGMLYSIHNGTYY